MDIKRAIGIAVATFIGVYFAFKEENIFLGLLKVLTFGGLWTLFMYLI